MKYESYCFLTPALSGSSSEGHVKNSILSQLAPLACLFLFYFYVCEYIAKYVKCQAE